MKKSLGAKTLVVPTPTWIVGTYDQEGRPNVMAAAWGGICCSDPPCIAVSLRKATYTYGSRTSKPSGHRVIDDFSAQDQNQEVLV